MNVLLLGVGMQGKAALHDLFKSDQVSRIVAADRDIARLNEHVAQKGYLSKVQPKHLEASDEDQLEHLMSTNVDVAIDLLPTPFSNRITAAAVKQGVHLVNTFYTNPEMDALAAEAAGRNLTILPECGLDPGIDLVLLGETARQFDRIDSVMSYGAGFPEAAAADNPIKYKISWTFEGVLRAYYRDALVIKDGKKETIDGRQIFAPEHVHSIEIDGFGLLEAYPNGDVLKYVQQLGLDPSTLHRAGRYAMRWPGHSDFWKKLVDLHLLDDDSVEIDGTLVNRRRFLAGALEPYLQYGDQERDVTIVRIEVTGVKGGKKQKAVYQMIAYRDLASGLSAMSRTVGYSASIGAILIGTGALTKRGLLDPMTDIPYDLFVSELAKRGIQITSEITQVD